MNSLNTTTGISSSRPSIWGKVGIGLAYLSIPLTFWLVQFSIAQFFMVVGMIATIISNIVILCQTREVQETLAAMNRDIYGNIPLRYFVAIGIVTAFGFMVMGHGILAFLNALTIIAVSILYHKLGLY